ncbi:MAG: hypothetical protein IKQ60_01645 [Candidatus Methanomethylophilaceae archaeon]|nr:hypothetical protein [Candidatus Methanomethylophilaceae archaeon]
MSRDSLRSEHSVLSLCRSDSASSHLLLRSSALLADAARSSSDFFWSSVTAFLSLSFSCACLMLSSEEALSTASSRILSETSFSYFSDDSRSCNLRFLISASMPSTSTFSPSEVIEMRVFPSSMTKSDSLSRQLSTQKTFISGVSSVRIMSSERTWAIG